MLQGPELLRKAEAVDALAKVPFVAVMATHEGPELDRAHAVLPAALWAEVEGTFTNYQRRVQRLRRAAPAPGEARPRWELAAGAPRAPRPAPGARPRAREVFASLAEAGQGLRGPRLQDALGRHGQARAAPAGGRRRSGPAGAGLA